MVCAVARLLGAVPGMTDTRLEVAARSLFAAISTQEAYHIVSDLDVRRTGKGRGGLQGTSRTSGNSGPETTEKNRV